MQSILRMSRSTTVCPSLLRGRVSIANQTSMYPSTIKRYSHQSYGGESNPPGKQPASRRSRELEHPGPPPPDTSKDSPSRSTGKPETTQKEQPQEQEQQKHEDLYHKKRPSNKAVPTLSTGRESPNVDEQGNTRDDVPEDVKRHNRELGQRYDRAYNQIGDEGKVSKGFWKGNGRDLKGEQGGARTQ